MEEVKGIKIKNNLLNELVKVGVLLFEEFPSTILYKKNDEYYIQEWVDCSENDEFDRYFIFKTDEKFIAKFIKSEISHFDLLKNASESFVFFFDKNNDSTTDLTICSISNIPQQYLPNNDIYNYYEDFVNIDAIKQVIDFDIIDTSTDLKEFINTSVETNNSDIYNLHILKGSGVGYGRIKTKILSDTLNEFDNLYKQIVLDIHLGKNRGNVGHKSNDLEKYTSTEIIQTIAASFSILIKPTYNEGLLFENLTSSKQIAQSFFKLINNSTETQNFKNIYTNFSEYTISSYKSFLKEIYNHNINIGISYRSIDNPELFTQKFDLKLANKIMSDIDTFSYVDNDSFYKIGKFRALNCDTGHFIFISNENETFSGYMDKLIKKGSEQILFTKIYKVSIERKITKEASKEKPKIEDVIVAFFEE